jgi:hypothetical protein
MPDDKGSGEAPLPRGINHGHDFPRAGQEIAGGHMQVEAPLQEGHKAPVMRSAPLAPPPAPTPGVGSIAKPAPPPAPSSGE